MDTIRYVIAFLVVVTVPPGLAYWLIIHSLIGYWRRLGPRRTYAVIVPVLLLGVAGMALIADDLLSADYGTQPLLWILTVLLYGSSKAVEARCRKHLSFRTMVGVPELRPPESGGTLIVEGIYDRIRHPRYVGLMLGALAAAFFVNYAVVYALMPLMAVVMFVIVLLEERELRTRFGAAYMEYARRVPRFIPSARQRGR